MAIANFEVVRSWNRLCCVATWAAGAFERSARMAGHNCIAPRWIKAVGTKCKFRRAGVHSFAVDVTTR
eukprot:207547-Rhodomonas_salina.2